MAFRDERRGFAFSDSVDNTFVILQTSNGGSSWNRVPTSALPPALPGEGAYAASGTNVVVRRDLVWIATTASRVLRSTDGGPFVVDCQDTSGERTVSRDFLHRLPRRAARHRRRRRFREGGRGDRQRRRDRCRRSQLDCRRRLVGLSIGGCLRASRGAHRRRRGPVRHRRVVQRWSELDRRARPRHCTRSVSRHVRVWRGLWERRAR